MVRSIAIEDVYDDPHKLDLFLGTGESVVMLKEGREVAQLMPILPSGKLGPQGSAGSGKPDFRARFLEMWGADAFQGFTRVSVPCATSPPNKMWKWLVITQNERTRTPQ